MAFSEEGGQEEGKRRGKRQDMEQGEGREGERAQCRPEGPEGPERKGVQTEGGEKTRVLMAKASWRVGVRRDLSQLCH